MKLTLGLIASSLSCAAIAADLSTFPPTGSPWGSIAPPALSSSNIGSGSETLYRVWFDNSSQEGDLLQHAISSNGNVTSTASWSAAALLDARSYSDRIVFKGSDGSYDLCDAGNASALEKFLCGDSSNEYSVSTGTKSYRDRSSKLGTLIHSNPVYVGKPTERYTFDDYRSFANTYKNRSGRIYVGGNDGLLHTFDSSGNEVFGFMPSAVESSITSWATNTSKPHGYSVDGPLTVADAHHSSFSTATKWQTVLVGGLGAGGMGYYALNVTTAMTAATAFSTIAGTKMWEFAPSGIGYTYGKPLIARTNASASDWALIAPNGYAAGGKPILYIRDLNNPGTVLKDFDTILAASTAPAGNGLSSPTGIDLDGDNKIDFVYAGDLDGNLWRFNLKDSTASNWSATKLFTATDGSNTQPIVAAPEVVKLTDSTVMVYFGSGDALGVSSASKHSFYALKDTPTATVASPYTRSNLQQRVISATSDANYRTVDESSSPNNVAVDWTTLQGWYTDLASNEHLLQPPQVHDKRVQFMAHNLSSGDNWLTHLEYQDGRLPSETVFDTNGDGSLSESGDNIDYSAPGNAGDLVIATLEHGDLISAPTLVNADGGTFAYFNIWDAGSAATGATAESSTLPPPSCTKFDFYRFDYTSDSALDNDTDKYDIKVTLELTDNTADDLVITAIDLSEYRSDKGAGDIPVSWDPASSVGSGTNVLASDGNRYDYDGMKIFFYEVRRSRVWINVEYDGPYEIQGLKFEWSSGIEVERLHSGTSTCPCTGGYSQCSAASEADRIEYGDSHEGVTETYFSAASYNGYSLSTSLNMNGGIEKGTEVTIPATAGSAGTDAAGAAANQLQSGDDSAKGRIRWRELTF